MKTIPTTFCTKWDMDARIRIAKYAVLQWRSANHTDANVTSVLDQNTLAKKLPVISGITMKATYHLMYHSSALSFTTELHSGHGPTRLPFDLLMVSIRLGYTSLEKIDGLDAYTLTVLVNLEKQLVGLDGTMTQVHLADTNPPASLNVL